jgi:hypothetical protein
MTMPAGRCNTQALSGIPLTFLVVISGGSNARPRALISFGAVERGTVRKGLQARLAPLWAFWK